ncbi:MAG: 50S ribosomal protein L23 [Spirochaetales bacterium]|jgi:large subunit ribosomal protein L23|nr:50S ribosomal protein L23 [Spirochaetales bacterium]
MMRTSEDIIIAPVLTEKSNVLREAGKYVFRVDARANKMQICGAVRRLFDVHPVACGIINVSRKPKRNRNRAGFTSSWKKAVVTLAKGEKIAVFEGA